MKKICLATSFLLAISTLCSSATIHVPADYPTIREGVIAAADGDTVLVAPGTYHDISIEVSGKIVHLVSSDGPEETVVDGINRYTILIFEGSDVSGSTVEGFTFINGGTPNIYQGGAIRCMDCDILVRNNIITNCGLLSSGIGGAIYCVGSSSIIEYNLICDNFAMYGGGIACGDGGTPQIRFNVICNNTAGMPSGSGFGGAISLHTDCHAFIHDNIIADNISYWVGGAIYSVSANADISRNTIVENWAEDFGGGMYISTNCELTITDNMIYGNEADTGGGIIIKECHNPDPVLINNTLYNNRAYSKGGAMWLVEVQTIIENTILWNNEAPEGSELYIEDTLSQVIGIDYSNVSGGLDSVELIGNGCELIWGAHMIDADPLFVDPTGNDFHLTYNSPCRDSGDGSVVNSATDLDGDPRIAYGTVDIGADEFHNHLYCTGDFAPNGSIEGKFIGLPGTNPVGLFIGSGIMNPPLQHKWGDFYLEAPWLLFPLVPIPSNGVLEIPVVLPSTPAPYDIPMQALIGWELSNLFVLEVR